MTSKRRVTGLIGFVSIGGMSGVLRVARDSVDVDTSTSGAELTGLEAG